MGRTLQQVERERLVYVGPTRIKKKSAAGCGSIGAGRGGVGRKGFGGREVKTESSQTLVGSSSASAGPAYSEK